LEPTTLLKTHYAEKNIEVILVLDQMSKILGAMQRLEYSPQHVTES
jgi:hypothetical protein